MPCVLKGTCQMMEYMTMHAITHSVAKPCHGGKSTKQKEASGGGNTSSFGEA